MRIDEMTTKEFREAMSLDPVIIIPLGATEAHGIHLPLGTDTYQPEYIAMEVAKKMNNILVAPTMPYGQHSSTKNMAGTISLTFDTLRAFIKDVLSSLIANGAKKIMIISGHAGTSHMCAITEGCREIVAEKNVQVMFFSDFFIAEEYEKCGSLKNDGHAGMLETSRMMNIKPDLVNDLRPIGKYKEHGYLVLKDGSQCFPNGMAGDTTNSSAEFGNEINKFIIDSIIRMIRSDFR
ncbi:MAG: creatininase family protein [Candidatus Methanomethylophilaceae archaeon]